MFAVLRAADDKYFTEFERITKLYDVSFVCVEL